MLDCDYVNFSMKQIEQKFIRIELKNVTHVYYKYKI